MIMASTKTTQSVESILPSVSTQPAPSSTSLPGDADRVTVSVIDQDLSVPKEVETLRRQVVALQRISSLGVLAGGVFHELNNALTPILNYAKLGLRNPDPAYRDRALARILDAGQRAAAITGGMLGLSRPGRDPNHRAAVDLNRLVEEVVLLTSKDLARNKVRLEVQLLGRPFARVNAAQIQQVLINLLINARQAMPDGGVVTLRLAPDPAGRLVELSVIDRGVGIAPENLRRIFEPFFSTKSRPGRLGGGRHRPGPGRLPRHRRGPPRPPPGREPPRPGLHLHPGPAHLPSSRRGGFTYRRSMNSLLLDRRSCFTIPPAPRKVMDSSSPLRALPGDIEGTNPDFGEDRCMASGSPASLQRDLSGLFDAGSMTGLSDRDLIERFSDRRRGHGRGGVRGSDHPARADGLRVCRNVLGNPDDADDAFQATFLVLVKQRRAIRKLDSVASWLYGVAARVSARARVDAARRRRNETVAIRLAAESVDQTGPADELERRRSSGPSSRRRCGGCPRSTARWSCSATGRV